MTTVKSKWEVFEVKQPIPIELYMNNYVGGNEWTFVHNSLFWVLDDAVTDVLRAVERDLYNAR